MFCSFVSRFWVRPRLYLPMSEDATIGRVFVLDFFRTKIIISCRKLHLYISKKKKTNPTVWFLISRRLFSLPPLPPILFLSTFYFDVREFRQLWKREWLYPPQDYVILSDMTIYIEYLVAKSKSRILHWWIFGRCSSFYLISLYETTSPSPTSP